MRNTLPTGVRAASAAIHLPADRAVALVNVIATRPTIDDPALVTDLSRVLAGFGERETGGLADDLPGVRRALSELDDVLRATDRDTAARQLDRLMARYARRPRLERHEGWDWHLHVDGGHGAPWSRWIASTAALELARMLCASDRLPWGTCAAPSCRKVFLSDGRGGTRRYCSTTCGTRERVRRHRRASQAGPTAARAR
jgi:hypothetical protein